MPTGCAPCSNSGCRSAGRRRGPGHRASSATSRCSTASTARAGDDCTVLDVSLDVEPRRPPARCSRPARDGALLRPSLRGRRPREPATSRRTSTWPQRLHQPAGRPIPRGPHSAAGRSVGAFGDSLADEGRALAEAAGLAPAAVELLAALGRRHQLQRLRRDDRRSPRAPGRPGRRDADVTRIRWPSAASPRASAAWPRAFARTWRAPGARARRGRPRGPSGVRVAGRGLGPARQRHAGQRSGQGARGSAIAIVSPKTSGGYLVSRARAAAIPRVVGRGLLPPVPDRRGPAHRRRHQRAARRGPRSFRRRVRERLSSGLRRPASPVIRLLQR